MKFRDLREFINVYRERGYYVLKAILEVSRENWGRGALGDFDFKGIKRKVEEYGIDYNPALLLSRLEKEYGVIETTYRSSSQHWWRIVDLEAIEEVVAEYEGRSLDEMVTLPPRARLLRIQFYALEPERILGILRRLQRGIRVSQKVLEDILFHKLPRVVDFLEAALEEYSEELSSEISLAEEILRLAEQAVLSRRSQGGAAPSLRKVEYEAPFRGLSKPE